MEFSCTRPDMRGRCEVGSALVMLLTLGALPARTQHLIFTAIAASGVLSSVPSRATSAVFADFVAARGPFLCADCALLEAVLEVAAGRPPGLLCRAVLI